MIVQDFVLSRYDWHVRVYYAVNTYWKRRILHDLKQIGCKGNNLERAKLNLDTGRLDTGLTYSNFRQGETVMVLSLTTSPEEFLNSWFHEIRHLTRHIEQSFGIDPYGEEAAYLAGNIGQKMFPVAKMFICPHCRNHLTVKP